MFENPRRGRQARNFTKNVPKILDLKSSCEQIFSENWRWVALALSRLWGSSRDFLLSKKGHPWVFPTISPWCPVEASKKFQIFVSASFRVCKTHLRQIARREARELTVQATTSSSVILNSKERFWTGKPIVFSCSFKPHRGCKIINIDNLSQ